MNNKYFLLLVLLAPLFLNMKCRKEQEPEGYFFIGKLDGNEYRANGGLCVNCISADLLGDTLLVLNGGTSTDYIAISTIDIQGIKQKAYMLANHNYINNGRGSYDNSFAVDDRFFTDSIRTGLLTITRLDKVKKEIEGTFYFTAYNPVQDKIVTITDGKFRINYRQ